VTLYRKPHRSAPPGRRADQPKARPFSRNAVIALERDGQYRVQHQKPGVLILPSNSVINRARGVTARLPVRRHQLDAHRCRVADKLLGLVCPRADRIER